MKDPEAEKQKKLREREDAERSQQAAIQKAFDEVESHKEWTPFQREKMRLKLIETYAKVASLTHFVQAMEEKQAANRRAEDDRLLSVGGVVGVAGNALLSGPTVQIAQADAMVKAGIPQAQARDAIARVDSNGNATAYGRTQMVVQAAMQPQILANANAVAAASTATAMSDLAPDMALAKQAGRDAAERLTQGTPSATEPSKQDFFALDRGKKIYAECINNEELTKQLAQALKMRGHTIAPTREDSDVYFRIEGEFDVPATSMHSGVHGAAGKIMSGASVMEPPSAKVAGSVATFFVKSIVSLASSGGDAKKNETKLQFQQNALWVASRQAKNEAEIRLSHLEKLSSNEFKPQELVTTALSNLFTKLNFPLTNAADQMGASYTDAGKLPAQLIRSE